MAGLIKAQTLHHILSQPGTQGGMAVEMPLAGGIGHKAAGFAQIVKQHGIAQHRIRLDLFHGPHRMLPNGIAMVMVALVKTHGGRDLRPENRQHIRVFQQHRQHIFSADELRHLLQNALGSNALQKRSIAVDAAGRLLLNGKAQGSRKAQRPHQAQGILAKAAVRLTHTAQKAGFQILLPAEGVADATPEIHGHGVDGKVPAGEILLQCGRKLHRAGVASVQIVAILAEGGDFHIVMFAAHRHSAVLQTRGNGFSREGGHHFFRQGIGGHIPVLGAAAHQQIPHAAAYQIGLLALLLQRAEHFFHPMGYFFHEDPSLPFYRLNSRKKHSCTYCIFVL